MERQLTKALRAASTFIGTLAIYLGLSLLGWGVVDLGGFFSSPARLAYAVVVASFAAAVAYQAVVAPEGIQGPSGREEKRVRRQTIVGYAALLLLVLGLAALPFCDRRGLATLPDSQLVRWPGVALAALGYALIFLSGIVLGRQYSAEVTIQENHNLITAGPYRKIRHPRYLGVLLVTLGVSLVFRAWVGLALAPCVLGLLLWRIADEEGADGARVRRRVAGLLPPLVALAALYLLGSRHRRDCLATSRGTGAWSTSSPATRIRSSACGSLPPG